jgi:DNA-binding NtrC family response regulator
VDSRADQVIVSKETMELLVNYSWPGNIRELQNVIERGVVLCQGSVLTLGPDFLPAQKSEQAAFHAAAGSSAVSQSPAGQSTGPASSNVPASVASRPASLEEVESRHILTVLDQTRGLISGPKCESGLVSGAVVYGPEPLEKPADGNLLVCCSQPAGDVVIDL